MAENDNLVKLNGENFNSEVRESSEPVIIDFWAEWCGPCRMMAPVFEELSSEYKGKLKFAKLNTEEHPEIAGEYGIQGIPCLIVTKKGEEVDRIVGFGPKDMIKSKIDSILEK